MAGIALTAGTATAENIKIGFNVPLTGFVASHGESVVNGAKLVGEMLGLHRAVILTIQNELGQSLAAGFKENPQISASRSWANMNARFPTASSARSFRRSVRITRT
ncbi:hypothetical protein [Pseudogemmobacter sp. W21_MBD1_M6]|uniref:hypothetical protein n=1 Tax=Pseudogemmobacter sp. W21_MBD1_M6 TaxID=3240271 RepID=UPI003F9921F3